MALERGQREVLWKALRDAYNAQSLEMMLRLKLDKRLDWIAQESNFQYTVFQVIALAEEEGWHVELIREAYVWNPGNPRLAAFVASFAPEWLAAPVPGLAPQAPAPRPSRCCFLFDRKDMPLINRQPLRSAVEAVDEDQATILVVEGPPRSGKTYSRYLVAHVAGKREKTRTVYVDLTEQAYAPDRLALNIVLEMDPEAKEDSVVSKASQDPYWAKELSRYIVGKAQVTEHQWWVILDGILQRDQPPETLELIRQLALRAATPVDCLRLVLLGYQPELLPLDARLWVIEDRIDALKRWDLSDFFETALRERGTAFLPDAPDPAVKYVVDRLPPPYSGEALAKLPGLVREAATILLG